MLQRAAGRLVAGEQMGHDDRREAERREGEEAVGIGAEGVARLHEEKGEDEEAADRCGEARDDAPDESRHDDDEQAAETGERRGRRRGEAAETSDQERREDREREPATVRLGPTACGWSSEVRTAGRPPAPGSSPGGTGDGRVEELGRRADVPSSTIPPETLTEPA